MKFYFLVLLVLMSCNTSPSVWDDTPHHTDILNSSDNLLKEQERMEPNTGNPSQHPQEHQDTKPVIQNLGVRFEPWNEANATSGDFALDRGFDDSIFIEFGKKVDGAKGPKRLPEYGYVLAQGSKIRAPLSGIAHIDKLYSDDYVVDIRQKDSEWSVAFEHIVNLSVKEGQEISVGQVLGEPSPFFEGMYVTEMVVWKGGATEHDIIKLCPFSVLNTSLRPSYEQKIYDLTRNWEQHIGKDVYDESSWVLPGCLFENLTEYEAMHP